MGGVAWAMYYCTSLEVVDSSSVRKGPLNKFTAIGLEEEEEERLTSPSALYLSFA
jgi:hypothetical protein